MTSSFTVKRHFRDGKSSSHSTKIGDPPSSGRTPQISRLMALAIRFDLLVCDGEVADQAELARLGNVSRARITQIMNLLNLAPEIQEDILHLSRSGHGQPSDSKRSIRVIATLPQWAAQRQMLNRQKRRRRAKTAKDQASLRSTSKP
jgi:hypothetical protein